MTNRTLTTLIIRRAGIYLLRYLTILVLISFTVFGTATMAKFDV